MPQGVPAGGIFKQVAAHSFGVLALDPVAVDLAPASTTAGFTVAAHGGQPPSLATQAGTTAVRFSAFQPSLTSTSDSAPRAASIVSAVTAGRERAELPEVAALAPARVPDRATSDAGGFAGPTLPDDSVTELTATTQELITSTPSPIVAGWVSPADAESIETEREEYRIPANLAIYTAASLTIGVSAPGLTSVIRGGKWHNKRRATGAAVQRAPRSPR